MGRSKEELTRSPHSSEGDRVETPETGYSFTGPSQMGLIREGSW